MEPQPSAQVNSCGLRTAQSPVAPFAGAMAPKALSTDEQARTQRALDRIQDHGLINQQSGRGRGRGRPRSLQPVAAALAYQRGEFNTLSEASRLTAAASTYGVQRRAVEEYVEMLRKLGPGVQVQTMAAARSRLRERMFAANQMELAEVAPDGNCLFRAMTIAMQDMSEQEIEIILTNERTLKVKDCIDHSNADI